jgi:Predicted beta-xylosidase
MSYTRIGNTELTDSMHLAYSEDGINFKPLHNNTGILYPKADFNKSTINTIAGTTKRMLSPYLFRMADNRIGILAVQTDMFGDFEARGKLLFYITKNFINYEERSLISLNKDITVTNPYCEYDEVSKIYRISWMGSDGNLYENITENFKTVSIPVEIQHRKEAILNTNIKGAIPVNILRITSYEAEMLHDKLLSLENTEIEEKNYDFVTTIDKIFTSNDLKAKMLLKYQDGSLSEKEIIWNEESLSTVNYSKAGTYIIHGKPKLPYYKTELYGRADPHICQYQGRYYFTSTDDISGQKTIYIREAKSIEELFSAKDHVLMSDNKIRWAPELHMIGEKLYLFIAIGDEDVEEQWKTVQCNIYELKRDGNPIFQDDWKGPRKVLRSNGSNLYNIGITLDMTYFEVQNLSYVIWAQRQITKDMGAGTSDLYIATIDKRNPYQLTSEPICILRPRYGWDRINAAVDEGPYIIQKNGKVYLTFSGSSVSNTYCVGLLEAYMNSDLLDPQNWNELGYPILQTESIEGEFGPGHSSFVIDEGGNDLFVYHTMSADGIRSSHVRRMHWAKDGTPVLDMTQEREVKQEYCTVNGRIIVEKYREK